MAKKKDCEVCYRPSDRCKCTEADRLKDRAEMRLSDLLFKVATNQRVRGVPKHTIALLTALNHAQKAAYQLRELLIVDLI